MQRNSGCAAGYSSGLWPESAMSFSCPGTASGEVIMDQLAGDAGGGNVERRPAQQRAHRCADRCADRTRGIRADRHGRRLLMHDDPGNQPGTHVAKGDELGYFQFGGSTYCLVLRPGIVSAS